VRRLLLPLLLLTGLLPSLAACDLLGAPPIDEDFGVALATYATGRATIEIGDEANVLDQVSPGPHLYEDMDGDVYWFNDDGWGLRLTSFGAGLMSSNDVTIDRVRTTYWSAPGYGDCIVDVETFDATGVRGTATCDGLRWIDQLRGGMTWTEGPRYVDGEPAFDATITFEAAPEPGSAPTPASPEPSAG
jgi:hypothetical protein